MKTSLLKILALAQALFFFSCGPQDPQSAIQEDGDIVQLDLWEYWDPSLDDHLDEFFYELEQELGFRLIRNHYEPTQLRDGFIQEAILGGGPDFIILPSDHLGTISLSGAALPADDFYPAEFFDVFDPQSLGHVTLEGRIWGIPLLTGNSLILFYNTDLIPTPPAQWDELIAMAKQHTSTDRWGLAYNLSSPFFFAPFFTAFGGSFFEPGSARPALDTPAMVQALEFLHSLKFRHGILNPDSDSSGANRIFAEGRAAFLINGPWAINQFVDRVPFSLTPLPMIGDRVPRPLIASGTLVFNKNLENKPEKMAALRKLIALLMDAETQVNMALVAREIPAIAAARQSPRLLEDEYLSQFVKQIELGVPLQSIPEMRLVFQSVRTGVEEVVFGNKDFSGVARKMQSDAVAAIDEL